MADRSTGTSSGKGERGGSLIERAAALIDDDPTRKPASDHRERSRSVAESQRVADQGEPANRQARASHPYPAPAAEQPADVHDDAKPAGADREPNATNSSAQPLHIHNGKKSGAQLLMPGSHRSRSIEEFRQIKRSILHRMYDKAVPGTKNSNLVLVTSARPNEGKTFVAINLAISLASEKDLSVLLVDVDQTNRGVRDALKMSKGSKGLNDIIENSSLRMEDYILDTDIEGLSVLPAGTYHPLGTELIASRRMAQILEELGRGRYADVVIFDAPPALATTEASILSQTVGQIAFVVEADRTSQTAISDALEIIGNSEKIGFVLNKTRVIVGDSQFGAYYSYGYGKPNAA